MKVPTYETLYHEDHGAYFEAQVCKKDSSIVPSLFSLVFGSSLIFLASFSRPESHPDLWGNHSLHHPVLTGAML